MGVGCGLRSVSRAGARQVSTARQITLALGGRWLGRGASCKCPAHEDASPSLSISETRDGRPLVHCFAGCSQGQVIDALRARGLWDGEAFRDPGYPQGITTKPDGMDRDERARRLYARELWDKALPIAGTLVETYLASRGIRSTSDALRYMPRLKHAPSGQVFPCMLAALTDFQGHVVAVQRTWLAKDGSSKAPVDSPKMTVGPMGHAAVKLFPCRRTLGLAEGIETAMSAEALYCIPTWATLSAGRLKAVRVSPPVDTIVIFADRGKVGQEEAFAAADYFETCEFKVDVYFPKDGADFNDALKARAS